MEAFELKNLNKQIKSVKGIKILFSEKTEEEGEVLLTYRLVYTDSLERFNSVPEPTQVKDAVAYRKKTIETFNLACRIFSGDDDSILLSEEDLDLTRGALDKTNYLPAVKAQAYTNLDNAEKVTLGAVSKKKGKKK